MNKQLELPLEPPKTQGDLTALALAFNRAKRDNMEPAEAALFMIAAYERRVIIRGIDVETMTAKWVAS